MEKEHDPVEKALKASFVSAANHLTTLYTTGINAQKQAFSQGYNKSIKDTMEWVSKNQSNKTTINTAELLEYLKMRLEASNQESSKLFDNLFQMCKSVRI